jgi:uncharacterized protein (DUF885 family)
MSTMSDPTVLIQALVDDLVAADPVLATHLGLAAGIDRLPTHSPAAIDALVRSLKARLPKLEAIAAGDHREYAVDAFAGTQIVRRVLRDFEILAVQHTRPSFYLEAADGVLLLMLREIVPLDDRLAALDARLRALPGVLEEARGNLTGPIPRVFVESALDRAAGVAEMVTDTVRGFATTSGRDGMLDDASRLAAEAVTAFRTLLQERLLPAAVDKCAAGAVVIADILRHEHVLAISADEIAATGRAVMKETRAMMAALAAEIGHASVEDAVAAIQTVHPTEDDLVASYTRAVADARDYVVERDLCTLAAGERCVVEPTPPSLRGVLPFAAYDPPGPYSAEQVGFYWVTPPEAGLNPAKLDVALKAHPLASLSTVSVHEAYPGHHVQLTRANSAPTLARRVAALPMGGSLLCEGWAFYCEEMMEREGFLASPEVRLMRLNDQIWRACRVVIDIELHMGRMSFAEAASLLQTTAHMGRHEAEMECRWYAESPGLPMSYLMGKLEVQALAREYARQRTTSLKTFHDEFLDWGSLPPRVIAWGMGLGERPF